MKPPSFLTDTIMEGKRGSKFFWGKIDKKSRHLENVKQLDAFGSLETPSNTDK
jgi:hypothetical protein